MGIFNNWGFNNFMPFGGFTCCCHSFNPFQQTGMMNSLFSMPSMYSQNFMMPDIFSMANNYYSLPAFNAMPYFGMQNPYQNLFSTVDFSIPSFSMMPNFSMPSTNIFASGNFTMPSFPNFTTLSSVPNILGLFNNSSINNSLISSSKSSRSSAGYGDYNKDATELYKGTASDLNNYLKGKGVLEGQGQAFLDAQKKYGISASVLAGICIHESGNGKSNLAKTKNNIGGIRKPGSKEFRKFSSVKECIDYMARLLKTKYVDKGLNTLSEINSKYCPSSDPTDTKGTNSLWAKHVNKHSSAIDRAA